jgi:hypothetical protein
MRAARQDVRSFEAGADAGHDDARNKRAWPEWRTGDSVAYIDVYTSARLAADAVERATGETPPIDPSATYQRLIRVESDARNAPDLRRVAGEVRQALLSALETSRRAEARRNQRAIAAARERLVIADQNGRDVLREWARFIH